MGYGAPRFRLSATAIAVMAICQSLGLPQANAQQATPHETPSEEVLQELRSNLNALTVSVSELDRKLVSGSRELRAQWADVAVFEKAVTWILKHNEFYRPEYAEQARKVLSAGAARAAQLQNGTADWQTQEGSTIRGYVSRVDGSIQPYALTLPAGVNPGDTKKWPLHLVLHGRANEMNEVNFIHRFEGRKPKEKIDWIQLDVYGRGSNAYRWAGETDVFEALDDVKHRFRIDEKRITLHGFSMGGAGAWHLGLHYPHLWSSVGPGAGFVDFYKYQKQMEKLPAWQHATLGIYDAVDYALNAANVPVCTYGGELDPQLAASTTMAEAAAALSVPVKVIVGPGMGHKFDPESQKQFMAFHLEKSAEGVPAPSQRKHIRFTTRTLKYNQCDWLTIEEVESVYQPSTVEAQLTEDGDVSIVTDNVTAFRISRDIASDALVNGSRLPCRLAADGLLPEVYYLRTGNGWEVLGYAESRAFAGNPDMHKRHGLQGPIDDAFMDAFVCVKGTGTPQNPAIDKWAAGVFDQFSAEFDQWMRGEVKVISDTALDEETIASHHLVLFGDPGSNAVLRKILAQLPIQWTADTIQVGDRKWDAKTHSISLIYPNPLNPKRYVVINSGHTIHDRDFKASNAWLFPRLGDIAVRSIAPPESASPAGPDGPASDTSTSVVWAANFNSAWLLDAEPSQEN